MGKFSNKLSKKVNINNIDDIFNSSIINDDDLEKNNIIGDENILNTIKELYVDDLHTFKNHPFKVDDDDLKMAEILESIKEQGVLTPIIVRNSKIKENKYEIVSGHRRKRACELIGLSKIPAIIKNIDDEESIIIMVDSNIQREELCFSEKAFAYKMKVDAIKRKGGRPKYNEAQLGPQLDKQKKTTDIIAEQVGISRNQIKRYIRLTYLIPELLDLVDLKKLPFTTAVELSYLTNLEQELILAKIETFRKPYLIEAKKIKEESIKLNTSSKDLNKNQNFIKIFIDNLLDPEANILKNKEFNITGTNEKCSNIIDLNNCDITNEKIESYQKYYKTPIKTMLEKNNVLDKYFNKNTTEDEIEKILLNILELWFKDKDY